MTTSSSCNNEAGCVTHTGGIGDVDPTNSVIAAQRHLPPPPTTTTTTTISQPLPEEAGADALAAVATTAVADTTALSDGQSNGNNAVVPRRPTFTRRHSIDKINSPATDEPAEEKIDERSADVGVSCRRLEREREKSRKKNSSSAVPAIPIATGLGTAAAAAPPLPPPKTVARICGAWRSKCGYCHGKRMYVLKVSDAHNKCIISTKEQRCNNRGELKVENEELTTSSSSPGDEGNKNNCKDDMITTTPSHQEIDILHTSKSYGLLFDTLPYELYETLVNRGWRRSGKICTIRIHLKVVVLPSVYDWMFGSLGVLPLILSTCHHHPPVIIDQLMWDL